MTIRSRLAWGPIISLILASAYLLWQRTPTPQARTEAGSSGTDPQAVGNSFDHSDFERLLRQSVSEEGWVDYAGLKRNRAALDAYLARLATAHPVSLSNDEQLALYINAYNAFTLADVLDRVYGKAAGVRQVSGFFDGTRHLLGGKELTLDEIEARGRNLGDPRIHFAVVCASTSCPKLQRFAYTGAQLDQQLDRAARQFLADPARGLRIDRGHNRIYLSSIFKWYAGDFTGARSAASRLVARTKATISGSEIIGHIRTYAPPDAQRFLEAASPSVHYLDYDWSLNSQEHHPNVAKKDGQ